jgi:hypothetical protein
MLMPWYLSPALQLKMIIRTGERGRVSSTLLFFYLSLKALS